MKPQQTTFILTFYTCINIGSKKYNYLFWLIRAKTESISFATSARDAEVSTCLQLARIVIAIAIVIVIVIVIVMVMVMFVRL